jgi:hypothetical protein
MKLTNPDIAGRGYVGVDNPESFDLPEPYSVNLHFQAKPASLSCTYHWKNHPIKTYSDNTVPVISCPAISNGI